MIRCINSSTLKNYKDRSGLSILRYVHTFLFIYLLYLEFLVLILFRFLLSYIQECVCYKYLSMYQNVTKANYFTQFELKMQIYNFF